MVSWFFYFLRRKQSKNHNYMIGEVGWLMTYRENANYVRFLAAVCTCASYALLTDDRVGPRRNR